MLYKESDQIVEWLGNEIKRMQNCINNCEICENKIDTYIHIRNQILSGKYKDTTNGNNGNKKKPDYLNDKHKVKQSDIIVIN